MARQFKCGQLMPSTESLHETVLNMRKEEIFTFLVIPLFHPALDRGDADFNSDRPAARSCRELEGHEWNNFIVGSVSRCLDVDSPDPRTRQLHEEQLARELSYAAYVNVNAVVVYLHSKNCVNLARIVTEWQASQPHTPLIWAHVPIQPPGTEMQNHRNDVPLLKNESTWEWWINFRFFCDHSPRIGVLLEVGPDLPDEPDLNRWTGELVRALLFNTSTFLTNKKGFPVLSIPHQKFLQRFSELGTHFVLGGPNRHNAVSLYVQYLHFIWRNKKPGEGNGGEGLDDGSYTDYLQYPLQPLMNNLESQTYEVFERDPVKYKVYGQAVESALLDRVTDEQKDSVVTVIMVMGAGRGPLVQMSLDAAERAGRKVKVYAVEKNPNAVITLQNRRDREWAGRVTVLAGDMRRIEIQDKADILVSELLGSFGDNELSPECLDGAQKFLKDDGISIPAEYTSYICPTMSHKLFAEARNCPPEHDKPRTSTLETPYVVLQKNKLFLSEAQPLFTFKHPNRDKKINNSRYEEKTFEIAQTCVLDGFTGFFHTTLYKNHVLSIVPETFSLGMFSWFPLYIPIQRPLKLQGGSKLTAHFWRRVREKDVWYEWTISTPESLPIHNLGGRSSSIGL